MTADAWMTAPTLHMRLVAMAASLIGAVRNLDLVSVSHSHADHVDALRDALDMVHEANVTCNHRHMAAMQALDDTRGELAALLMTIQTSKALRVPDVSSSWKTDAQPPHAGTTVIILLEVMIAVLCAGWLRSSGRKRAAASSAEHRACRHAFAHWRAASKSRGHGVRRVGAHVDRATSPDHAVSMTPGNNTDVRLVYVELLREQERRAEAAEAEVERRAGQIAELTAQLQQSILHRLSKDERSGANLKPPGSIEAAAARAISFLANRSASFPRISRRGPPCFAAGPGAGVEGAAVTAAASHAVVQAELSPPCAAPSETEDEHPRWSVLAHGSRVALRRVPACHTHLDELRV